MKKVSLVVLGILMLGVIVFKTSNKNYEIKEITTNSLDEELVAVRIQNESNNYEKTSTIPTSGYTLNTTESFCGIKQSNNTYTRESVEMTYANGKVTINRVNKDSLKCFLYFDKAPSASEVILADNTVDTSRKSGSFTGVFQTNTAGKIFEGPADDSGIGSTYIFAGANPNNWVKFGKEGTSDIYWRIIRINSDGTVRMIYNGTSTTTTGTGTQINGSTYAFNTNYNDNAYVGYMYGSTSAGTYADTHKNTNNSTIKTQVETWYNTNLNKAEYSKYIDINVGFCGDRTTVTGTWEEENSTGLGYGIKSTYYGPASRSLNSSGWESTQTATLKCTNNNDLYTSKSASRGNKALTYPVGLITADEVKFAGGFGGTNNSSYWLYTNIQYLTMSPYSYNESNALVFCVNPYGFLNRVNVRITSGVRPVINLRSDIQLTGSGTTSDPYTVQ